MTVPEQKKAVTPRLRFPEFRDAGPWEVKRLGEFADVYQPETISQSILSDDGEFFVYGANGIIGRFNRYNHEHSQIAVTCRGSTCGEVTLTRPRSWITGNSMVINVDNCSEVIKAFLYFQLKATNLNYLITGSGQPQITGEIKKHKVTLPSIPEQQKIADCLSSLDELIELQ
ncbi:restriction endonuclease subunit S, partial [Calditerrivibrio sp.]|uniref:restriction endonuclease subunit S n=1 Tax=Calditerrivibrio sp. TaxID=2792612 RepID=UPI003D115783